MYFRSSMAFAALAALALTMTDARPQATDTKYTLFDPAKYPDFSGQWKRPAGIGNQFDQTKPPREKQQVEFTPEYQKIFEANLKDQAEGGQGTDPTFTCIPDGMPRAMNVIFPM